MAKKYEWRMPGFAKGIDPGHAVKEIKRIERLYGSITPENILSESKKKSSLFHSLFTWDDSEAANQYRLGQARQILNNVQVIIISDGEPRKIPVYEVVRKDDTRIYKHLESFTPDDIEQIKARTIGELHSLRNKLSVYDKFYGVVKALEATAELVKQVN